MTAFFNDLRNDVPGYVPGSFERCFGVQAKPVGRPPKPFFPPTDRKASPTQAEQYQRDLETLDRIELQNECFFDAMGEFAAGRARG